MSMAGDLILAGIFLAKELRMEEQVNMCNPTVDNFFKQKDISDDCDPLGSDCEVEHDKCDDGEIARTKRKGNHHSEYKHTASITVGETDDINGVLWEKDIDIPLPEEKSCLGESQIKSKYKSLFDTE
eukprot:9838409-Ditylum_brightwellii.AAC.1